MELIDPYCSLRFRDMGWWRIKTILWCTAGPSYLLPASATLPELHPLCCHRQFACATADPLALSSFLGFSLRTESAPRTSGVSLQRYKFIVSPKATAHSLVRFYGCLISAIQWRGRSVGVGEGGGGNV